MAFLRLLGYPALELDAVDAAAGRSTQRHRLALLALLGANPLGWSRDKLVGMLWPESSDERARNSLNESVYVLRRTLGEDAILSVGDELRLNCARVACDVRAFDAAMSGKDWVTAVSLYRAPFLDGFYVGRAPDFERWSDTERSRLLRQYGQALEGLAESSARRGDLTAAVEWWRKLAALEPFDARIAVALMRALDAAGDKPGALNHARIYSALVRQEFGVEPDARVTAIEMSLRTAGLSRTTGLPIVEDYAAPFVDTTVTPAAPSTTASVPTRWLWRAAIACCGIVLVAVATYSAAVLRRRPSAAANVLRAGNPRHANKQAYELFLQGRELLSHHREADVRAAIDRFKQAIASESAFALPHAGLAIASAEMHLRFATPRDAHAWGELAVGEARRALELDSTLAEVHEALAAVHRKSEFDWDATVAESRRALALNPSASMPHFYIGGAFYHLGLLEEAERAVRAGLQANVDADRAEALRTLGTVALAAGRYGEAVSLFQDVQRVSDRPVSDPHLAVAYFYSGDTTRAIQLLETLAASGAASAASRGRASLASILAARGDRAGARVLVAETTRGQMDHHVAYSLGAALAALGEPHDAVRWLRVSAETGFPCYPWYARDPLLAPLRGNPEFEKFMRDLSAQHARARIRYRGVE